ncbi:SAM-dependent methyltransferase, partial [Streptomyces sp. NPDC059762]|uniref:SAM-dependent methyltransferase n=1 Tax=Streptomyces sp. NPDC059762 TaxID=3346938 RepID=UPI003646D8E2
MSPTSPTTSPVPPVFAGHGHVTFLGAGPGDPGLLTLRAVEALAGADVLIAEPEVLDVVRCHARAGVCTPELRGVLLGATNPAVAGGGGGAQLFESGAGAR